MVITHILLIITQGRQKQLCIGWAERGGAREVKVGGTLFSSHPVDLNARNISNSANMQRWQNTKQARHTIIKSGRGALPKAVKEGESGGFPP